MTSVSPSLSPPEACVHLWLLSLDPGAEVVAAISTCLSHEERTRAARFRHPDDSRRYSVARGALRWLVTRYLDVDPGSIRFDEGPHGKPGLAQVPAGVDLQFNLSHSGDVALAAFGVGRPLGVDIERMQRAIDPEALIARFGSPGERAMLQALRPDERQRRFLQLWTCKEAWLKATGLGIAAGLERVDVDLSTGAPHLVGAPEGWGGVHDWSLSLLEPTDSLIAAVALHDPAHRLGNVSGRETLFITSGLTGERIEIALLPRGTT